LTPRRRIRSPNKRVSSRVESCLEPVGKRHDQQAKPEQTSGSMLVTFYCCAITSAARMRRNTRPNSPPRQENGNLSPYLSPGVSPLSSPAASRSKNVSTMREIVKPSNGLEPLTPSLPCAPKPLPWVATGCRTAYLSRF
jgi:hypothetical protein